MIYIAHGLIWYTRHNLNTRINLNYCQQIVLFRHAYFSLNELKKFVIQRYFISRIREDKLHIIRIKQ